MTTLEIQPKNTSFRTENTYDPHVIYSLLTRDYKPHNYTFENNWENVATSYDPVHSIEARVEAILLANYVEGADRSTKSVVFFGSIDSGSRYLPLIEKDPRTADVIEKFQNTLFQFGIDADYVNKYDHFVVRHAPLPAKINLYGRNIIITYPHIDKKVPGTQMDTPEEFAKHFAAFFDLLEKTLRATYAVKEKQLPPNNLVFVEPNPVTNKESLTEFPTKCAYCDTPYLMTPQTFKCPSCGAPPKFPSQT